MVGATTPTTTTMVVLVTAAPKEKTRTRVMALLEVNDFGLVDVQAYAEKMRNASSARDAVVDNIDYKTEVHYEFDGNVSVKDIISGIAHVHNVTQDRVSVTVTRQQRRLQSSQPSAVTVQAIISTDSAMAAQNVRQQAANETLLSNALADAGIKSSVVVTRRPKATVAVVLSIHTMAGVAYQAPSMATLQRLSSEVGATNAIVTSVQEVSGASTTTVNGISDTVTTTLEQVFETTSIDPDGAELSASFTYRPCFIIAGMLLARCFPF